jgi:uncharacterized protein
MSHLTDEARAASRNAQPTITAAGTSLEEIVAANPDRRRLLKNGLLGLSVLPLMGGLTACDDDSDAATPTPTPSPSGPRLSGPAHDPFVGRQPLQGHRAASVQAAG